MMLNDIRLMAEFLFLGVKVSPDSDSVCFLPCVIAPTRMPVGPFLDCMPGFFRVLNRHEKTISRFHLGKRIFGVCFSFGDQCGCRQWETSLKNVWHYDVSLCLEMSHKIRKMSTMIAECLMSEIGTFCRDIFRTSGTTRDISNVHLAGQIGTSPCKGMSDCAAASWRDILRWCDE